MFQSVKSEITTDSSGAAEVYLTVGVNRSLGGFLVELRYNPGTIDTGADLTITGETSGVPILTKSNAGTSLAFWRPRAFANSVSDGAESTTPSEFIPIKDERIKVVVANGGNAKTGSIEAILINNPPY